MLPATVTLLGALVIASAWLQRTRVEAHLTRRADEHLKSVARVLLSSTQQTAQAVESAYLLAEAQLSAGLWKLSVVTPELRHEVARQQGLHAWWFDEPAAVQTGPWSDVPQRRLRQTLQHADLGRLFEDGLAATKNLACVVVEVPMKGGVRGRGLGCMSAKDLARMRRESGPGHLLETIVKAPLRYVVLEDADGVIVASPNLPELDGFEDDPVLGQVLASAQGTLRHRTLGLPSGSLREGLSPFTLPDGSRAVLRIGLQADLEHQITSDIRSRHRVQVAVVLVAIALAWLLTLWLMRREATRAQVARTLQALQAEQEQWCTIGLLAATVAHEVRNPLNAIEMCAQRLALEFKVSEKETEEFEALVGVVRSEGTRVNEVVTDSWTPA